MQKEKTIDELVKKFLLFTERNNRNLWGYELKKLLREKGEEMIKEIESKNMGSYTLAWSDSYVEKEDAISIIKRIMQ